MLSNITAGNAAQIEAVYQSGCVPQLIHLVQVEEFDVRKEAAYALCNACIGGIPSTVSGLVYLGVLPTLCSLLQSPDADLLLFVLDATAAILAAAQLSDPVRGVATVVEAVEAAGGCAQLEALQAHQNTTVYERVSKLLETYFSADEPDDPAVVPTAHADSFSFGVPVLGQPTRPFAP